MQRETEGKKTTRDERCVEETQERKAEERRENKEKMVQNLDKKELKDGFAYNKRWIKLVWGKTIV